MIQTRKQGGFTVIELLIATAVFSVVLLMVTFGIMQITRVYYKGVTETNTQNTARSIADSIAQTIQFGGTGNIQASVGSTPGTSYAFCIGNQLFSYVLGYQVMDSPTAGWKQGYHALVVSSAAGCGGPVSPVANLVTTKNIPASRELLGQRMRLSKLSVQPVPGSSNLWNVDVKIVYGDDDLINNPTLPTATCKSNTGSQFCAVSELNTIVEKRVE
ncbi:MAG TPA: prepilin-type N-terminal cleavage/methylation domain-containing protein [Candidatus Saccharimonadales bacterium]|nr:prepilin-type N-terminal cleavage/methylation domain-containing protein [Candidatus Saccharimonadales bacterium]